MPITNGFEPLIWGSRVTALPLRYHLEPCTDNFFCYFPPVTSSGWIWTLDIRIASWLHYHFATTSSHAQETFFCYFLDVASSGCIRTLDIRIVGWLLFHFTTTLSHAQKTSFCYFSLLPMVGGFEPLILGSWVNCTTTLLPPRAMHRKLFSAIFSLLPAVGGFGSHVKFFHQCATTTTHGVILSLKQWLDLNHQPWDDDSIALPLCYHLEPCTGNFLCYFLPIASSGCIWTLDIRIMSQLCYHFATTSSHTQKTFFCYFSLLPMVDGIEPLILGSRVTALPLLPMHVILCLKQWLEPLTWDDDSIGLPLRYHHSPCRWNIFVPFSPSPCQSNGWTRTLDLEIMSQLQNFFVPFSL